MKAVFRISTLVWAGMILGSLGRGAPTWGQDVAIVQWGAPPVVVPGRVPEGVVAVASGYDHGLGLQTDGSIVAWGLNDYGQCNVPAPNSGFVAVAGAGYFSLGLKADGSIAAWGRNNWGQCDVPAPNSGFTAVAAGYFHGLGLKADTSVVAWGQSDYGQCSVPPPNSGFVAVAAGGYHSLGLKATYGDLNCDGFVDFADINPFVLYLVDNAAWRAAYPRCHALNGDVNQDGTYGQGSFGDINPFVALLTGG